MTWRRTVILLSLAAYPALRATYAPRPGDANLQAVAVTLPPQVFLAQEHIDTVCTRALQPAATSAHSPGKSIAQVSAPSR